MRQLPHLAEMAENTPGLHVVGLYAQVQPLAEIESALKKHNVKFPNAFDSFWDVGYEAPSLPKVWIVGVEGKVVFVGRDGYEETLKKELAKVKYPGLGRAKIHKELEPAAKAFGEGKFAEAYNLAEAVYDETEDDAAEEDADYIMGRIDDRLGTLSVRADTTEVTKNYRVTLACLEEMLKYKGLDDAEEAPERLKKLKESEEVKKELDARHALLELMMSLDVEYQKVDDTDAGQVAEFRKKCLQEYRKFAKDKAGTGAADKAQSLIETFEALLPDESKPEEKPKDEK